MKKKGKIVLNLGCGDKKLKGAVNVDKSNLHNVDIVHDLNIIPYPFPDAHADEIHMYHVLEHLDDPIAVMEEVHRILKPGGILYLRVPHFSSLYAWGDITHKRAYSLNAFDIFDESTRLRDLGYTKAKFKIKQRKLRYFYTWPNEPWYEEQIVRPIWPKGAEFILKPWILFVNFLIGLSPQVFERFWCYYVGGAAEIYMIFGKV
ncbi:class I SAM-dependent methyltransferase [Patescibacteria group bacterium]|nr:class I SAM-dependent methyltransferase [Patescibacteria group bacterium]